MRIVCWQTILLKYHALFLSKLGKMSQNVSSAAVVIGALRVSEWFENTIIHVNDILSKYTFQRNHHGFFSRCLTHLNDFFSIINHWTSMFAILWLLGGIIHYLNINRTVLVANTVDLDQMPHSAVSVLELHYLPMIDEKDARFIWVNVKYQ